MPTKRKIKRVATDKLSISLPKAVSVWLAEMADNDQDMGNKSAVLRRMLLESMNKKPDERCTEGSAHARRAG